MSIASGLSDSEVKLLTSVFWPAVALILACVYKQPITGLLRRLQSLSGPGFKAAFGEKQAAEALEAASAISGGGAAEPDAETRTLISQAATDPWWAARQSWRRIRAAARKAGGGRLDDGITTPGRVRTLFSQGVVGEDTYRSTQTLAHGYFTMKENPDQVTAAIASDYADAAGFLVRALQALPSPGQAAPAGQVPPGNGGPPDSRDVVSGA